MISAWPTAAHGLVPWVDLSTKKEWLGLQTPLSYPLDSCCLMGYEQISNMTAAKLVECDLKLGVLTDQLSAMLDKEPLYGTSQTSMVFVNNPKTSLNFFFQIMTFLLPRNLI